MKHKKATNVLTTLRKARSHLDKIISMIEEDAYCIDILQQLNAIDGYIDSARRAKLASHLNGCFVEGMQENDAGKRQEYIDEVIRILKISK